MKKRGTRSAIIAVFLLGALIFGGVYYAWNTLTDIFQPVTSSGSGKGVSFVIQNGETTAQIASDLQAKGLIRNALAFRIWARIRGLDTHLQAGAYDHLDTSMTIDEIITQLLDGQPDRLAVSIPEGLRIEQIAARFAAGGLVKFNVQDFLKYTKHPQQFPDVAKYPILKSIPSGYGMEGLLYPDTYLIPVDGTARNVVNMMLTEFDTAVQQHQLDVQAKAHKLSVYQMVILASLVQREIAFISDAPGVAGVYWNRALRPNDQTVGFLESDPSVEYSRDTQTPPQSYWKDLNDVGTKIAANSLWNTYTHKGFPPTPICSPGLAVMEAAAAPPMTDYYFFLGITNNQPPGKGHIVYAKTYAEFQQDEQTYLQH